MKFTPQTVKLKNNKIVIVREGKLSDAENIYSSIDSYLSDSKSMILTPQDYSLDNTKSWISSYNDENSLLLVALDNNRIVGNVDITPYKVERMKHMATIGMAMLNGWREVGLGRYLSNTAIQWTKDNPNLEKLWVEIFADNPISLHGARTTGFKEIVTYKDYYKTQDGYVDNIVFCLNTK